MAKRKKSHHKTPARRSTRRRMGAVHSGGIMGDLQELAGVVIGSLGATMVQRQSFASPKIIAGLETLGGIYLKNHATNQFMKGLGYGALAVGSVSLLHDVGVIRGVEEFVSGLGIGMSEFGESQGEISYSTEPNISGIANETVLSGIGNDVRVSGTYDNNFSSMGPLGL